MGGIITGIIQAMMQASAMAGQQQIERENLAFQRDQAAQQRRLATANRTDAYGNEVGFDELLNEWRTKLAPRQQQIMRAGEREQLLSVTEDAERNRDIRRRQDERARRVQPALDQALAGLMYEEVPSEGAIRDQLVTLLSGQRSDALRGQQDVLSRQALRLGRGADIPKIIAATDERFGDTVGDTLLRARQGAFGESQARQQAKRSRYEPIVQLLSGLQDSVGTAPQRFSSAPQELSGRQGEMLQAITQAIAGGAGRIGQAYGGLASAMGRTPDLGGIGSGIDSLFNLSVSGRGRGREEEKPIVYNPSRGEEIYWPSERLRYRSGSSRDEF